MIDLSAYYSGGYFLLKQHDPGWWEPEENDLLPEKLISLSTCICPRFRVSSALKFGVPGDRFADFDQWCATYYREDASVSGGFYSTDGARRFIEHFLPDTTDLLLIGVGLPRELEEENWREEPDDENNNGEYGIDKQIERCLPLEDGGTVLGFEVVSYEYGDFGHSWLCSGLDQDMHELFGIRPNPHGLLATHEDAEKVYQWIAEDNMQGHRAEPEPYDFWVLVSYPLAAPE